MKKKILEQKNGGQKSPFAVSLKSICKSFGPVRANDEICLNVSSGTIHGIIGENGAGKSTLMSILYGFYQPDSGDIQVDGKAAIFKQPSDAIGLGLEWFISILCWFLILQHWKISYLGQRVKWALKMASRMLN